MKLVDIYRATLVLIVFGIAGVSMPASILSQQLHERPDEDYQTGMRLFQEGLFQQAASHFEAYSEQFPESPFDETARFYWALSLSEADSANAPLYAEQFIGRYPQTARSGLLLRDLGQQSFETGDFGSAQDYFHRALERPIDQEKKARIMYRIAEAFTRVGETGASLDYFLQLADDYEETEWAPKALFARGRVLLTEERYEEASEAFELLRERFPRHEVTERIGTALGESYYRQQRYEEAISSLRDALQHVEGEQEAKAVLLIAESHNYLNQLDRAATQYRRYINLKEGEEDARLAHYGLGWVYHKQQVYHWAAESFGRATEGDDELARKALYYKAVNEKLAGRRNRALDAFNEFGERYREGEWVETAYYEWALTAFEEGYYPQAIEPLQHLLQSGMELENRGDILTMLGEAFFANNEYTRAVQAFEEAEELVGVDEQIRRQARFQRGWVLYENHAYEQAQAVFQDIHEQAPASSLGGEALFWSADSHYHMENFRAAERQFREFVERYPAHEFAGAATYSLGWTHFKQQQFEEAAEAFRQFLEHHEAPPVAMFPYDVDARLRLGDALYAQRSYAAARDNYEQVTDTEDGGDYAIFQIANSYHRDNDTFDAVQNFRRLLRLYPGSSLREQSQYNIGYIYFLTGNYDQAIEEFEEVVARFPNSEWAARAKYNIGDAYYNAGDYGEAVEAYRQMMERYPRSDYVLEAINGIQFAQMAAGEQDTSNEILEEFLAEHPQTRTADRLRFRRAESLWDAGDYEAAISSFRQYMRVTNAEDLLAESQYYIARSHERLDEPDMALQAYQQLLDEHAGSDRHADALLNMAEIRYERRQFDLAVDRYEALLEHGTDHQVSGRVGMGHALLELDRIDDARQAFEMVLQQNDGHDDAQVGMGRVALARGNYEQAIERLSDVAERNTSEIGAKAQFYYALALQQQSEHERAVEEFARLNVLYEAYDRWVARSMLQSAESHRALGDANEARRVLERVRERYPDTREANEAARRLD